MDLNQMRNRMTKAEKELMPEARLKQFQQMQREIKQAFQSIEDEKQAKIKEFDSKAEFFKPDNKITITDKEKEMSPEMVLVNQRKFDSKNVAVMDYLTKTVLSRLASEVETAEDFLGIVSELAHHESENMRYVLIDSFHEIVKVGQGLDRYNVIKSEVKEALKQAKQNVKTKEQLRYEQALDEAEQEKSKLSVRYLPIEKNIQEFANVLNGKTLWLQDQIQGDQKQTI
ncbi:hypothetical protein DXT76_19575 [Halobacillus trueperi]|uniref:Uncharacterized protein n=1 Tax=Halobacillus trueperi TaxID=156205 RepID=A0A3D8VD57_9BACI|nr:hypothetical protein [Halobacillus trueperi]RDY67296.1 hypothetical protein DXT76_19575 [Halobacillus trueperi]